MSEMKKHRGSVRFATNAIPVLYAYMRSAFATLITQAGQCFRDLCANNGIHTFHSEPTNCAQENEQTGSGGLVFRQKSFGSRRANVDNGWGMDGGVMKSWMSNEAATVEEIT